ncbi:hypothetical protein M758_4G145900 [Ceratodon purpureus]|nr:hypothetical protein M758_4G145900 [Ceratodon purpureus]
MALGSGLQVWSEKVATKQKALQEVAAGKASVEEEKQQQQQAAGVVVPSFFLCPISLELMRDPVTLSTGMTYDRASIEKWLGFGNNTCPTTNQVLESDEMIPNHTLRRLIQSWCEKNQAYGVERIPTPKAVLESDEVRGLLHAIARCPERDVVKQLWRLAKECEHNRKCIAQAGAVAILAAAIGTLGMAMDMDMETCSDALGVISLLQLNDGDKKALANPKTLSSLSLLLLTHGSSHLDAKINTANILLALCEYDPHLKGAVGELPGAIKGLLKLLKEEDLYPRAITASLRCLLSLCLPRRNRVLAIDHRAISIVVELLPNTEKRNKELCFALLELLASCAEGREAISNSHLAIPMIVKSMLGVSHRATEHAVATLWVVLSYASNRSVINTALQAGAFTNLLMLLPSECSQRAKLKARDCLKLLNEVWGSYTCRPADDFGMSNKRNHVFATELV